MELEDIVDKYRSAKLQVRALLLVFVGVLPALYVWTSQAETLDGLKLQAEGEVAEERGKFEGARQKVAELPVLLAKLSEIEDELTKAKQILPDKIEIDSILASLGNLEKELDVKLVKFTPGQEVQPNPQLEYKEIAIDLDLRASFPQTMRYLDRLVHMPNLTHIRNIQFSQPLSGGGNEAEGAEPVLLDSRAKLILFRGI